MKNWFLRKLTGLLVGPVKNEIVNMLSSDYERLEFRMDIIQQSNRDKFSRLETAVTNIVSLLSKTRRKNDHK